MSTVDLRSLLVKNNHTLLDLLKTGKFTAFPGYLIISHLQSSIFELMRLFKPILVEYLMLEILQYLVRIFFIKIDIESIVGNIYIIKLSRTFRG